MRWLRPTAALLLTLLPALVVAGCAAGGQTHRRGDVIGRTVASTVQLFVEREGAGRRAGSAVVLSVQPQARRTLLLTAGHLLEPPAEQSVYVVAPPSAERLEARVLAVDAGADLALLEAPLLDATPVELAPVARLGDGVWVVAFPMGQRRTLVNGVVSRIAWDGTGGDMGEYIEGPVSLVDAPVTYGSSGGGVFASETGALVGIVRGYRTAQLALPIAGAKPLQLPLAGETTVVPTARILCFAEATKPDGLAVAPAPVPPRRPRRC